MFTRAIQKANLTPLERAILKAIELSVIAGLVALAPVFAQLANQQAVDWSAFLRFAAGTFATAALAAVWKYLKAQGDTPLLGAVVTLTPATLSSTLDTTQTPASVTIDAPALSEATGSAL